MKKLIIPLILSALIAPTSMAQSELYLEHFNLEEVVLEDSPLFMAMERNFKLLMEYDTDRLLTPFIRQAGLSTKSGSKYYGWQKQHPSFTNWGGQSWSLEGHIGGHYLSALAGYRDGKVFSAARNSLPRGIYIIGGKKIIF